MYLVAVRTYSTDHTDLGEQTIAHEHDVNQAALRIWHKARGRRDRLDRYGMQSQYFRTSSGYPIGTHHISIGQKQSNGLNIQETVIASVEEL